MNISKAVPMFRGKPNNYGRVDNFLSRSAQPKREDFEWLKQQGVTDIINFRTMYVPALDFVEKDIVESLGMSYHNLPSISKTPEEAKIGAFLNLIDNIKQNNGKAHIHCKAGADRTGMYSFIYKMRQGIGTLAENKAEWIKFGHDVKRYPNMISWTENLVKKLFKK